MRESAYQARLIKRLMLMWPDAIVMKNPSDYIQGIPDLLILYGDRWAALEVKGYLGAPNRPNQEYWVDKMNTMSYASFICPETEEGVLNELQHALGISRKARIS